MSDAYPAGFDFLNKEHEVIRRELSKINIRDGGNATAPDFRMNLMNLLRMLENHHKNEEEVMAKAAYPHVDTHTAYHRHSAGVIETIIKLYDTYATPELRERIAKHIANTVGEEVFFDAQLMQFLAQQDGT